MRIIVSARDFAAGESLLPVIQALQGSHNVFVYASSPAYDYLQVNDVDVIEVPITSDKEELLSQTQIILDEVKPNAILTGLSGLTYGIDEAFIALASCKTFSLQDFWGDANTHLGKIADVLFVLDKVAEAYTQRIAPNARAIITGNPKFEKLAQLNFSELRKKGRALFGVENQKELWCFFGQPLWDIEGYEDSLRALQKQIQAHKNAPIFVYRPHPVEDKDSLEKVRTIFQDAVIFDTSAGIECALYGADKAFSIYSSIGLDLVMANIFSEEALGVPVNLLMYKPLQEFYRKHTRLDTIPLDDMGVGVAFYSEKNLPKLLEKEPFAAALTAMKGRYSRKDCSESAKHIVEHIEKLAA